MNGNGLEKHPILTAVVETADGTQLNNAAKPINYLPIATPMHWLIIRRCQDS